MRDEHDAGKGPATVKVKWKAVYTVVTKPDGKTVFIRIGTAFPNKDGSMNVKLDAVPVNGTLHIRDAEAP